MLKQFYEKALPSQGVYCATGIDPVSKKAVNKFAETLDDLFSHIDRMKSNKQNTFVALGSFDGFRDRKSTRLNSSHIPLSRMPSSA